VVLWSIGNELQEQFTPGGWKLAAELAQIVREEDSTRPITAGLNNIEAGYNGFQKAIDVFGYNYKPAEYGRSTGPIPPSRCSAAKPLPASAPREYFFPVGDDKPEARPIPMSSYDLYAVPWGTSLTRSSGAQDENPGVAGEFVWTGFDYIGEPTPTTATCRTC